MYQDSSPAARFDIPFPRRSNPAMDQARRLNQSWLISQKLASGRPALFRYLAWNMAELGAYAYPDATLPGLQLAIDTLGWYTLFDDQLEGASESRMDSVMATCDALTSSLGNPSDSVGDGRSPVVRAWVDLWQRQIAGMSLGWRERAARDWTDCFQSFAVETANRDRGVLLRAVECLALRRVSIGAYVWLDLVERVGRCELPREAWRWPGLPKMRDVVADVSVYVNDVFSLMREEVRNDPHNVVLALQRENGASRAEAIEEARRLATESARHFSVLEESYFVSPAVAGLSSSQLASCRRVVTGMGAVMRGHYDWYDGTRRYSAAEIIPAGEPAFNEDLL